jgi:flagellar motor switch/type III secretory pathway protein FliN
VSERNFEGTTDHAELRTPLVGRLEVGTVTLPATEWLRLKRGDVVVTEGSDRSVAIRVAGQVVAWGELVTVDGAVGVRIQHLGAPDAQPPEAG